MMNTIETLIDQATIVNYVSGPYSENSFDEYKFAELIIRECIKVIEPDDHPVDEINYRYSIISDIKNHFGINDENTI